MKLGFFAGQTGAFAYTSAATLQNDDTVRIVVNLQAYLIWPLLHPNYSPSERAGAGMFLAAVILHELCVSLALFHRMTWSYIAMLTHHLLAACNLE